MTTAPSSSLLARRLRRRPLHPLKPATSSAFSLRALVAAMAVGVPALQAQAADPAGQSLKEVTVSAGADASTEGTGAYTTRATSTATRLDLSIKDTPQSISVVTRSQMDDFALQNVNEVLDNATGIQVERIETDRTYYSARGFDISNFQVDGLGLPFTNGGQEGDMDTALFDRVEVLRGANGLMSSTGNPSATINFVRKRPTTDFQASAGLSLGSWNNRRLDADIAGPLNAAGTLRGRLVLADQDKNSYLDRYSLHKQVLSAVLEADLAPGTRLSAGLSYQKNQPRGSMWGALPLYNTDGSATQYPVSTSTAANWSNWNTSDTRSFVELAHQLDSGWQIKGVLSQRLLRSEGDLFYAYGTPDASTGLGLYSYPSYYRSREKQTLVDVYASGPFDLAGRRHELVLGASTARSDTQQLSWYSADIGTALPSLSHWTGNYTQPSFDAYSNSASFVIRRQSVYGTARWNLSDRLKLFTGGNVTQVDSSGQNYGVQHQYAKTKALPYLGGTYALDAQHNLYASYAGIFNPQTEVGANLQPLPPIEGRNLEVGAKGEWFERRLNASASVFRTQQNNTAEATATYVGSTLVYSTVDATSTGFELDVGGRLTPAWELSGGFTHMRIRNDSTGADARTYVPRQTLRLSTVYKVDRLPGLKLGANLRWQSQISRDQGMTDTQGREIVTRQAAYALVGLMARYDFDAHWSATFNIDNLTDRKYINSLYWAQGFYGAPRNAKLSVQWRF
ncbi:MAG: TonB-dependent siderophore receptor [Curvibacter lanceolatus]|uniref:TonB-dependent siderophore receptor n=1 Tax=Curvibacter lanceolatus TaxID=86182 RepID=UPI00035C1043|nr:TonB-dependent siderophore receptor [Curvibacter lanceolatus]MBV5295935.1 TonB-dependent siderophore receptor [Curvibacter lanceolatus]